MTIENDKEGINFKKIQDAIDYLRDQVQPVEEYFDFVYKKHYILVNGEYKEKNNVVQ